VDFFGTTDPPSVRSSLAGGTKTPRRAISSWRDHQDITHRKKAEEETNQRNRELSLLNRIAMALNNNLGLSHVLPDTLDDVLNLLGLKRGAIILIDRTRRSRAWKRAADFRNTTSPTPASWCSKISCSRSTCLKETSCSNPSRPFRPSGRGTGG